MNTFLTIGAGAIALIAAAPFALPSAVTVEREAVLAADSDVIYDLLASNEGFQTFNPYRDDDPNLAITLMGPDRGVGSVFAFKGDGGTGTQTITAMEPGRAVTMQIDLGAMGQPVQTFTLTPVVNGTKVNWSTEAAFGMNPIGRVIGLFLDGRLGPVYERGLKNLEKAAQRA
jgi:hypothetical protein